VLVFDVRRLASASPTSAAPPLVATLARPRPGLGACFDAEGGLVVAGGGAKGAPAARWVCSALAAAAVAEASAAHAADDKRPTPRPACEKPSGSRRAPRGATTTRAAGRRLVVLRRRWREKNWGGEFL